LADFGIQLVIWFGFYFSYLAVRHLTYGTPGKALVNGLRVISLEQRITHHLFELSVERIADSSSLLLTAAAWTYWNSEFTVIGLALLWVYRPAARRLHALPQHDPAREHHRSHRLRVMPTAPPWMFPAEGFVDGVNHSSALLQTLGNPYAAMPSLHAADALIVGWFLVATSRTIWAKALWALWPLWVWFCVVATANHYLLDVLAGIGVAVASLLATTLAPKLFVRLRGVGPTIANLL
jgi:membrane-associated phospholipid phosphatase